MGCPFNKLDIDFEDGYSHQEIEPTEEQLDAQVQELIGDAPDINIGRNPSQTQKSTISGRKKSKNAGTRNRRVEKSRYKAKGSAQKSAAVQEKSALVIGLDFGTTYSGVSYRSNLDESGNQIQTIVTWPSSSRMGQYLLKMPSRIAYKKENQAWGPEKKRLDHDVIGYEVQPGMKSYTWFKLLLDAKARPSEYDDHMLGSSISEGALNLPVGKTAVEVATDFLRMFKKIFEKELARTMTKQVLKTLPIHFWITMPALWDDYAQMNTAEAFREAGYSDRRIDKINFVSEPEAAIVAALKQAHSQSHTLLKEDMCVTVVDIGGGTVDLESMKVTGLLPLKLKSIGVGDGGKCGATTVDRRFIAFMNDRFGEDFRRIDQSKTGPASNFMIAFETEKKAFGGDMKDVFRIPLAALVHNLRSTGKRPDGFDFDEGEVILTGKDMVKFFAETINLTCKLIEKQVRMVESAERRSPNAIVLAGGLSGSEYVFNQIERFCRETFRGEIDILRPENAWGAISYGAVLYSLDRSVMISRTARRHYLMVAQRAFQEGIDPPDKAVMCPIGGKRVSGSLESLLKKGQQIGSKTSRYLRGYIAMTSTRPEDLKFTYKIYFSKADREPEWETDEDVEYFGDLQIDLTPVVQAWARKGHWNQEASGKPIRIGLNIVVQGGHAAGLMHIAANANSRNVGKLDVNYST